MRRKLYGNTVEPACAHCRHGKRTADGRAVLCPHKGVVPLYHRCRRYVYDPLRRIPSPPPAPPAAASFSEEDFRLD